MPSGDWKVVDGVLRQTSEHGDVRANVGSETWSDYTLSLKARKLSGSEGFLIIFQAQNEVDERWWNIGGWTNTGSGLLGFGDDTRVPMKIEKDRWYDIRVELNSNKVSCYLDDKLIHELVQKPRPLYAVASRTADSKELILKVVNTGPTSIETAITLAGITSVKPTAKTWTLTSPSDSDENSFAHPEKIVPTEGSVCSVAQEFINEFPARSVTIMRIEMDRPSSPVSP